MWFALLKRSGWRLLRAAIVGFSLVVLALAWGITLQRLAANKAVVVDTARTQQNNLSVIVSENLEQLLDGVRTIAFASREWWEGSPHEVTNRLTAMRAANPAFLRISLYDVEATRVYSSSPVPDDPFLAAAVSDALQAVSISGVRMIAAARIDANMAIRNTKQPFCRINPRSAPRSPRLP